MLPLTEAFCSVVSFPTVVEAGVVVVLAEVTVVLSDPPEAGAAAVVPDPEAVLSLPDVVTGDGVV